MEDLRLTLEVLTGQRVRFQHIDFNTRRTKVWIGERGKDISFVFHGEDSLDFTFTDSGEKHLARFDFSPHTEVRVANITNPDKLGKYAAWWVGRSGTDRRKEPTFLQELERRAKNRGLTLEQLLEDK